MLPEAGCFWSCPAVRFGGPGVGPFGLLFACNVDPSAGWHLQVNCSGKGNGWKAGRWKSCLGEDAMTVWRKAGSYSSWIGIDCCWKHLSQGVFRKPFRRCKAVSGLGLHLNSRGNGRLLPGYGSL